MAVRHTTINQGHWMAALPTRATVAHRSAARKRRRARPRPSCSANSRPRPLERSRRAPGRRRLRPYSNTTSPISTLAGKGPDTIGRAVATSKAVEALVPDWLNAPVGRHPRPRRVHVPSGASAGGGQAQHDQSRSPHAPRHTQDSATGLPISRRGVLPRR